MGVHQYRPISPILGLVLHFETPNLVTFGKDEDNVQITLIDLEIVDKKDIDLIER